MYNANNRNNNFRRNSNELKTDVKFDLVENKEPVFKTITTKDGEMRDLFEFWVIDESNKEIQCVAWNDTARKLNSEYNFADFKKIIISYWKKINKINGKLSYSIKEFKLTN